MHVLPHRDCVYSAATGLPVLIGVTQVGSGPGNRILLNRLMRPDGSPDHYPLYWCRALTPRRCLRYIRARHGIGGEPRTCIPHGCPCHRCSKPCRRAGPVDSPWRKAEALISNGFPSTRFPIEADVASVHLPYWRITEVMLPNAVAPICFQGSASPRLVSYPWTPVQDSNLRSFTFEA